MSNSLEDSQQRLVYLVRHGEAVPTERDPERPLSKNGRQAVERIACWAVAAGVRPSEIMHSGKLRAAQTAEILAEHLQPSKGISSHGGLGPNDGVDPIADVLSKTDDTIMLVGHLPFLGRLVGRLVAGNADCNVVQFEAGGLVGLTVEDGEWSINCAVQPDLLQ